MTVKFAAEVLGQPTEQTVQVEMPKLDETNPEIERTWAWHRVEGLLAEERRSGSAGSQKAEIVRLCEDFSIVSEYASFLVLENDGEYQRWSIDRKNAGRMVRDRAARSARRARLRALSDAAVANLGPRPEATSGNSTLPADPSKGKGLGPNVPLADQSPLASNDRGPAPGRNFNFGTGRSSGGGGGAIDPVSAAILMSLAGMGAWSARRRKPDEVA